jgi:hypothetical protein
MAWVNNLNSPKSEAESTKTKSTLHYPSDHAFSILEVLPAAYEWHEVQHPPSSPTYNRIPKHKTVFRGREARNIIAKQSNGATDQSDKLGTPCFEVEKVCAQVHGQPVGEKEHSIDQEDEAVADGV